MAENDEPKAREDALMTPGFGVAKARMESAGNLRGRLLHNRMAGIYPYCLRRREWRRYNLCLCNCYAFGRC